MGDPFIELRGDFPREDVDVLDAVVQATPGANRTALLREILADWCERKRHEASLIARVTQRNGSAPAPDRHIGGGTPETQRRGRAG